MTDLDQADVVIRPPFLYGGGLAAACLLELIAPLGPGLFGGGWKPWAVGLGLAAIGVGIAARAIRQFNRAGTTVPTSEPTDALVTDGIFRFSRNPIYIALNTLYFGLAVALTSLWALILMPGLVWVLHKGVVLREEAYLERKFGETYRAYKAKVPRWL